MFSFSLSLCVCVSFMWAWKIMDTFILLLAVYFLIHGHIFHQQRLQVLCCKCEWKTMRMSAWAREWVSGRCMHMHAVIKTEHFCTMPFYRPIGSKISYLRQPITNSNNSKAFHLYARQCANFASRLFRFCILFLCHMRVFYSSFWCHPFDQQQM